MTKEFDHLKYPVKPVVDDPRDFKHEVIFGATTDELKSLPKTLGRGHSKIKDQQDTNFCTAFATSTASEFQEGVELSPEFQASKVGEVSGYPIINGADPRKALEAARIFGSVPQSKTDWTLKNKAPDFLADWHNWPTPLDILAYPFEKQSYFRIDNGKFDAFDNIRLALAKGKADNAVGIAFTQWQAEVWNYAPGGFVTKFDNTQVSGFHAYVYIDFDETYKGSEVLVVQNSCGEGYGDKGLQYFTRDVVNAIYTKEPVGSAAYMFRDLSPEVVKHLNAPLTGPLLRYLRRYFPSIV